MTEDPRQKEKYLRLLRQSFLLQGAGEDAAQRLLLADWRVLRFEKGQCILGSGLNQDCLGLIISGRATAYSGTSAILRGFAKGDVFGAAAIYAPAAETVSRVVAEAAGEVLLLPFASIQELMRENPRVAENYIRFLAQRIAFLNRKIAAFTAGEAKNRLAAHIANNCRKDEVGRLVFSGNISKLAHILDTSRASLYRALAQLSEQELLHREGKIVVIEDLELLKAYK